MSYTDETVHRALAALALASGNAQTAAAMLAQDGVDVDAGTLRRWRNGEHAERYERIRQEFENRRDRDLAERMDDLTAQQLEAMQDTLDAYKVALENGKVPPKDLAGAIRNLATSMGIGNQNSRVIRDKPTVLVEHSHSIEQLDAALRELGVIDGQAKEIVDAELVPGDGSYEDQAA